MRESEHIQIIAAADFIPECTLSQHTFQWEKMLERRRTVVLLNMKFLPEFFKTETGIDKFARFLRTFVDLEIPHIQFNVVRKENLLAAKEHPEEYRSLTVRVAGYTAYFTELASELQDEIIARTSYDDI